MGANTYIGNAPNFMVKSIAEESGVPTPSFFGYIFRYSLPILIPVFILVHLQRLLDILMAEENDIHRSTQPRINLEYAVVKMAYLEPLIPIDEIIARMEGLEQRLVGGCGPSVAAPTRPAGENQPAVSPPHQRYEEAKISDPWQTLKEFIREKHAPLSSKIDNGTFLRHENDRLTVGFPKEYLFLDHIKSTAQMELLSRMAGECFGRDTAVEIEVLEQTSSGTAASTSRNSVNEIKNEALRHPLVQKVMDVFQGAQIVDVRIKDQGGNNSGT